MQHGDLTQVRIEDLMNVEVTSASKKEQKLSRTAAAIFVIIKKDAGAGEDRYRRPERKLKCSSF
jgi:acyl-CoA hydrolase